MKYPQHYRCSTCNRLFDIELLKPVNEPVIFRFCPICSERTLSPVAIDHTDNRVLTEVMNAKLCIDIVNDRIQEVVNTLSGCIINGNLGEARKRLVKAEQFLHNDGSGE